MALTATTSRNPDSYQTSDGVITLPLATSGYTNTVGDRSPNVGDIVCWDETNYTLYTPTTQADMAHYVGISEQEFPVNSSLDSAAANANGVYLQFRFRGVCYMYTNSGDLFTPLCPVYFDENDSVQTVTSSTYSGARTVPVGYYIPSNTAQVAGAAGANGNVTGASGTLIPVWLKAPAELAVGI